MVVCRRSQASLTKGQVRLLLNCNRDRVLAVGRVRRRETPVAGIVPFNKSAKSNAASNSDASAEELLAFERMLADLSARFANVPVEKVELEIRAVQAILLKFLGFDRCTFAEFQDDGTLVVLSSTAVEGVEATPSGPLPKQLDWFVARLRAGETFKVQDPLDDLPPEAVGEAEYFRRTGMHSHLS